jgi:hypothetical protein
MAVRLRFWRNAQNPAYRQASHFLPRLFTLARVLYPPPTARSPKGCALSAPQTIADDLRGGIDLGKTLMFFCREVFMITITKTFLERFLLVFFGVSGFLPIPFS